MRGCRWQWLGLMALSGLLFFTNLGAAELWDDDEPIFAGAAREMMDRQEWVVPYFNSAMLPDKPALHYWAMIGAYRLLGVSEFAARSVSAVFAIGTVLLTWWLGRRMFSSAAGCWAGIVLATAMNFDVVARAATPDALLAFFSTLAIACFAAGTNTLGGRRADGLASIGRVEKASLRAPAHHEAAPITAGRRSQARFFHPTEMAEASCTTWPAIVGSYVAMGLAVLDKGPIGVLLPAATIGLFLLVSSAARGPGVVQVESTGRWAAARRLLSAIARLLGPRRIFAAMRDMRLLVGVVIVLAVAGPWYLAVGLQTEGAWLAGFFGKHNLGRFLHPMEHHRGPFFYYLIAVVVGFFPWSLLLGPTWLYVKSQLAGNQPTRERFWLLLCWAGAYVGFFSLAATKLPSYIVPAYPALALLVGVWMDAWLSGEHEVPAHMLRVAWVTTSLVGIGLAVAMTVVAHKLLGGDWPLTLTGLPWLAGGAICWWQYRRGQPRRAAVSFAVAAAVASLAIFGGGTVAVGRYQTSALFAGEIQTHTEGQPAIVRSVGYWRPSLVFYLRQPVEQFFSDEQVRDFCRQWPYRGFLLITGERYRQAAAWLPPDVTVLARRRWFLRSDQILLLGRATELHTPTERLSWQVTPKH